MPKRYVSFRHGVFKKVFKNDLVSFWWANRQSNAVWEWKNGGEQKINAVFPSFFFMPPTAYFLFSLATHLQSLLSLRWIYSAPFLADNSWMVCCQVLFSYPTNVALFQLILSFLSQPREIVCVFAYAYARIYLCLLRVSGVRVFECMFVFWWRHRKDDKFWSGLLRLELCIVWT